MINEGNVLQRTVLIYYNGKKISEVKLRLWKDSAFSHLKQNAPDTNGLQHTRDQSQVSFVRIYLQFSSVCSRHCCMLLPV